MIKKIVFSIIATAAFAFGSTATIAGDVKDHTTTAAIGQSGDSFFTLDCKKWRYRR